MSFKLYKNDTFLQRSEVKLKSFKEKVPLSSHTFELKDEPEDSKWACYALFDKDTKEIETIAVKEVSIANRNSHYKIFSDFEEVLMQWTKTHISYSEAQQCKLFLYKLKRIDQIEYWEEDVCQCETCGKL